jgi:hypothetical protein
MKAIWNNQVIANSDNTVVVEGNHYFPADSLDMAFFRNPPKPRFALGKALRAITTSWLLGSPILVPLGTMPSPKQPQAILRAMLRSGKGL